MENSVLLPQKIKIELPYDPVITFLGICPKELKGFQRGTYTPMFIAGIPVISPNWEQPKHPSVGE